ncbi:hypothetical protein J6590_008486 [Homalodisca vitripennis]|nr:hypothetical protein J6590_008486 [Homalodisca vitripennis]
MIGFANAEPKYYEMKSLLAEVRVVATALVTKSRELSVTHTCDHTQTPYITEHLPSQAAPMLLNSVD